MITDLVRCLERTLAAHGFQRELGVPGWGSGTGVVFFRRGDLRLVLNVRGEPPSEISLLTEPSTPGARETIERIVLDAKQQLSSELASIDVKVS